MSKTILETLKEMRETLADPANWRQGDYAGVRIGGVTFDLYHNAAINQPANCWCILGALLKAEGNRWSAERHGAERALERAINQLHPKFSGVADFNDSPGRTHEEVLQVIDHAIKREQGLMQ